MLDDYCQIAREVALAHKVPYMDIRGSLKRAVPWYRLWYAGFVTKDGEHTNERGTWILADLLARQLLVWFEGFNSSTPLRSYNGTTPFSYPNATHFEYDLDDVTI
jgi:hypothetical protein